MCDEEWIVLLFLLQCGAFIWMLVKLSKVQSALEQLRRELKAPAKPETRGTPAAAPPKVQTPPPAPPVRTVPKPSVPPAAEPSDPVDFDRRSATVLERIWNWICVGEEYRRPDLSSEYAVAAAWLIRLAILTLLAGIGFLAKYMIEHSLFPPILRVAVLALLAVALFAAGLRLVSGRYSSVAKALIGLSFADGFLCIFTAVRLYGLISVPWGYLAMILLTGLCMFFSARRNYLFPALIAAAGGYLVPLLLNSRSLAPEWQLGYLTLIGAGVLFCAFFRSWRILYWQVSVLYFIAMLVLIQWFPQQSRLIIHTGFGDRNIFQGFINLNFVLLALIPLVLVNIRKERLVLPDVLLHCWVHGIFFLLTACRFATCTAPEYVLRWCIYLAGFLALVQLPLAKKANRTDQNWTVLQLLFLSGSLLILIPLEFSALWVMSGWMILFLILLALANHLQSAVVYIGSLLCAVIAIYRVLIRDLIMHRLFLKEAYVSAIENRMMEIGVLIAGLFLAVWLLQYSRRKYPDLFPQLNAAVCMIVSCVGLGFLFLYSSGELWWCLQELLPGFRNGGLSLWWGVWALLLLLYGILRRNPVCRTLALVLFGICTFKIFLIDLASLHALYKVAAFLVLGLFLLTGSVFYTRFKERLNP